MKKTIKKNKPLKKCKKCVRYKECSHRYLRGCLFFMTSYGLSYEKVMDE